MCNEGGSADVSSTSSARTGAQPGRCGRGLLERREHESGAHRFVGARRDGGAGGIIAAHGDGGADGRALPDGRALHGGRVLSAAESSPAGARAVLGDILFATKPGGVGGSDTIYAIASDGSRPLRKILAHGWMPDLSPDGTLIAYTSSVPDGMDIFTMHADGSGAARLTGNDFPSFKPVWSPDGKKILFDGFPGEFHVANADGTGQVRLADNGQMGRWSPDGKRIAYIGGPEGNNEIYVMNADGTDQINLTNRPSSDGLPVWSPDGKRIAFASDRTGNGDIYVMDVDGKNVTRLTSESGVDSWPAWSPDGTSIAFTRQPTKDGFADIWVMKADGTGQRDLTNSPNDHDDSPSWR